VRNIIFYSTPDAHKINPSSLLETMKIILLILLVAMCQANYAQKTPEPIPDLSIQSVYVSTSRDPDWKPYSAFVAGMRTFMRLRNMAHDATLRFLLAPHQPNIGFTDLILHLEWDNGNLPISINNNGYFVLPFDQEALDQNAEITMNKKKGLYRWRPDIRSLGVPMDMRRMGDLRLECAVRWSIEQADIPTLFRTIINSLGTCTSAHVKVDFVSARPISAIYLISGTRREVLTAEWIEDSGHIYLPPVDDTTWPNDTLLQFLYQDSEPTL
jgi:hypothetical protein